MEINQGGSDAKLSSQIWLKTLKKFDSERYVPLARIEESVLEKVAALYVLNLELANIPWKTADKDVAILKLKWWEECIDTIEFDYRYKAHPFLKVLGEMVKEKKLDKKHLKKLVNARYTNACNDPFLSVDQQADYIEQTAVNLTLMALNCFSSGDEIGDRYRFAKYFGMPFGTARLLLGTRALAERGLYSVFLEKKSDYDDLFSLKLNDNIRKRLKAEADMALKYLKKGITESRKFRKREIFSVLEPALGYIPALMSIRKNPDIVLERKINLSFYNKNINKIMFSLQKY